MGGVTEGGIRPEPGAGHADLPNPVARVVFVGDVAPFVPVWLFGIILAVELDRLGLGETALPLGGVAAFIGAYTTLVFGLVATRYYWDTLRCPTSIALGEEEVVGFFRSARGSPRAVTIPFRELHDVTVGGILAPRLDARTLPDANTRPRWETLYLTRANAARLLIAWQGWAGRTGAMAHRIEQARA